jgi:outer membrane murein-binding lipoprotein Lpp
MNTTPKDLSTEVRQLSAELKRLEERLKAEPPPDPAALSEFRHRVDNVRLTAWSASELIHAEGAKKGPDSVLAFLTAERLRRFEQLVKSLCGDMERGLITVRTEGIQALFESVNDLQQRLVSTINRRTQGTQGPGSSRTN